MKDFQCLNKESELLQEFLNLIEHFSAGKDVSVSLAYEPSIANVMDYFQSTNRSVSYSLHHTIPTNVAFKVKISLFLKIYL